MNQGRWIRLFNEPVFFWALAVSALISLGFGANPIRAIMLVTPPSPLLLSHFTPVLCAFSIAYCGVLQTNVHLPDIAAFRVHRLVRYVVFSALTAVSCALVWTWKSDPSNALIVLRNSLLLIGISGLLNQIRPVLAWLVPITLVGASVWLGVDFMGEVRWWALVIQPVDHKATTFIAAVVWLVNLFLVFLKPRYAS